MGLIQPRTLKGFRDFLPSTMIPREQMIETARNVYRSYGFSPIDTPVLEYLEVLSGKGSEETDRLMYSFADHGKRQVGMRFDLTVPFARFAAQHAGELGTPFKRYHIAKVWRGENTHRGRYREFMQCDFDTIGTDSIASDIETVLVVHDLLLALGIEDFQIRINNRKVLSGLLDKYGLSNKSALVLRSLDKLPKIGTEKVLTEMTDVVGISDEQAKSVLQLASLSGSSDAIISSLDQILSGNETGEEGIQRLRDLLAGISADGVPAQRIALDVSIARGLDYYTGTIVETFLDKLPEIGSVCSGGRYDNLAELYTKQKLPGIGASLGLDRLFAALVELGLVDESSTTAPVFIAFFDSSRLHDYISLARQIRQAGFGVELFPEPKKLGPQLKYANRRGFRVAIVAGENEFEQGTCQVKDLKTGDSAEIRVNDLNQLTDSIRTIIQS